MKKLVVLLSVVTIIMGLVFTIPAFAGKPGGDPVPTGMAIVAKVDGDYEDPVTAMNDLATWCGTPGPDNPCLVKIRPGVYDIGDVISMVSFVDIEGSGENVTILSTTAPFPLGFVRGASNCEIKDLSIRLSYGTTAIRIENKTASKFSNITIDVSGIYFANANVGIVNIASSTIVRNVTINVSDSNNGFGILDENSASSLSVINTKITVNGGSYRGIQSGGSNTTISDSEITTTGSGGTSVRMQGNIDSKILITDSVIKSYDGFAFYEYPSNAGTARIHNSIIDGFERSISVSNPTTNVSNTQLIGPVYGPVKCIGAFNDNYDALSSTCQ